MFELSFNCPEDPTKMERIRGGFKCDLCSHKVIDFTGMSNVEIQEVLNGQKGKKTCGIYKRGQLVNPERSRQFSIFKLAFVAVFVLGMNTSSCFGQDSLSNETIKEVELKAVTIFSHYKRGTTCSLEDKEYHVGQNPWGHGPHEDDEIRIVKRKPLGMVGFKIKNFFRRIFKRS